MSILDLVKVSLKQGVFLYVEDERLKYELSVEVFPEKLKQEILKNKQAIIEFLSEKPDEVKDRLVRIGKRKAQTAELAMSFSQQRLWFIDQLDGGSPQYNMPMALKVEGAFDVEVARQAVVRIIERHEPLRTVFKEIESEPLQVIRDSFYFRVEEFDLKPLSKAEQSLRVESLVNADAVRPFDLKRDLMVRASWVELSVRDNERTGILLFNMHHIASDGWSMGILIREFMFLYDAILHGNEASLAPLAIQYADYAHWQREWLQDEVFGQQLNFWQKQLSDAPAEHGLPLSFERPAVRNYQGDVVSAHLSKPVSDRLQAVALENRLTPFMLIHAALALVLARHSNRDDILIGTPVAGRSQLELESLIGFFVNTLVLRVDTNHEKLVDYLKHVRQVNLDAQACQDVPFEHLVEHCHIPRSTRYTPLFQILFTMDTNETGVQAIPGLQISPVESDVVKVKFDLEIGAQLAESGIDISWQFDTSLFKREQVELFSEHLTRLLIGIAEKPTATLRALPMLCEQEVHRLVYELNESGHFCSEERLIQAVFESQVERYPDKVALMFNEKQLTYRQLNEQANQLAHYLREQGVRLETLVGIYAGRSLEMVVGMLGVLKAGGTYVPLDPDYPYARLELMLKDSGLKYLLTRPGLLNALNLSVSAQVIELDVEQPSEALRRCSRINPQAIASQSTSSLASVIYTSGSTGRPKGVMVEQSGILRLVIAPGFMSLDASTRFIQAASVSFDAITLELWGPLLNGGCSVIYPFGIMDLQQLNETIRQHQVNAVWLTAGLFEQWSESLLDLPSLRWVLAGGDIINPSAVERVYDALPQVTVINGYGPTENTTFTCCQSIARNQVGVEAVNGEKGAIAPVPIGRVIHGSRAYVLSSRQALLPEGVTGELYVAGDGLARGYLNQPELTAEKFIQCKLEGGRTERLYKTGDRVYYLADGELMFVGRSDAQVKIRGFRIEPGEIEHQLLLCSKVQSSLVLAGKDRNHLVAYVVVETHPDNENEFVMGLRETLQGSLPEYMLPSAFVLLNELPLTVNGKVDRKALPEPEGRLLWGEYIAPETKTEKILVNLWSRLLKLEAGKVSVQANFFEVGGHSLLAVRLVSEVRRQFDREVPVRQVFEMPTIRGLANFIERDAESSLRLSVAPVRRESDCVLASFAQQRLWFIDQLDGGSPQYNMPIGLKVEGRFDVASAEQALIRIIARHEPLRTVFQQTEEGPLQVIQESFEFKLEQLDLKGMSEAAQKRKVDALLNADAAKPFDLGCDLMVRASWIELSGEEKASSGILLFNMHHIASDGWSMGILINEFATQYEAVTQGLSDPLSPLAVQYADYACWQREWLQGEVLDSQLGYWEEQLAEVAAVHGVPLDFERPAVKGHDGDVVSGHIVPEVSHRLQEVARDNQLTPFMLLHAALGLVLSRHSHSQDIVIGTPVANRLQAELESLIGFFVNTLVLRTDSNHEHLSDYLQHVRQVNLDAQSNQDIPFEYLVEHCQIPRSTRHTPLFQIMFTMNTNEAQALAMRGLTFSPLEAEHITAKFDLNVSAEIVDNGIDFSWEYDTSIFTRPHVETLNEHLLRLLEGIAEMPIARLCELPMLSDREIHHLLYEMSDTKPAALSNKLVHELFEERAWQHPEDSALLFADRELSYRQLNEMANQLAFELREQGVKPDTLVALCIERSPEMVIAILAILKAGGAYVPLDPDYPEERLQYILEDARPEYLICQSGLADNLKQVSRTIYRIEIDTHSVQKQLRGYPNDNLPRASQYSPSALAYVLYTSGSTGQPKGVLMPQSVLANLMQLMPTQCEALGKPLSMLQFASVGFDMCFTDIFMSLLSGGCLHLISSRLQHDLNALFVFLKKKSIARLNLPYGVLQQMAMIAEERGESLPALRVVISTAEQLQITPEIRAFFTRHQHCQLVNHYGPSETHVVTGLCLPEEVSGWPETPSVGCLLPGVKGYLLNSSKRLVPLGCVGELYIGEPAIAREYLRQPKLTREKFTVSSFYKDQNERLYRTGDLMRYLPDGDLEYVGRTDEQLKIRGFRVEPGEVAHQLSTCDAVRAARVLARTDEFHEIRLLAYLVVEAKPFNENDLISELRESLQSTLPDYMIPSAFVLIDEFPLTVNGKLDVKALPVPDVAFLQKELVVPETEVEKHLVKIWSRLLKQDEAKISVMINFFEAGGHSLLAVRLVAEIRKELKQELPVKEVFETPTIRGLARLIEKGSYGPLRHAVTPIERNSNRQQVSFAQQRLWFIDQLDGGSPQYNMPITLKVEGEFNIKAAEQALVRIIERHEVLRTVLKKVEAEPVQVIQETFEFNLSRYDLKSFSEEEQAGKIKSLMRADAVKSFNLAQDLMVRACWIELSGQENELRGILLFNIHHIAFDGWSMGILLNEFVAQYEAVIRGRESPFDPLEIQYADYAYWQRKWLQGEVLENQLSYWQDQLAEMPAVHDLPLDFERPAVKRHQGDVVGGYIAPDVSQRLQRIALECQLTPFMLLHGALALVLSSHSNNDDILIGTPVANRLQAELESLIGFFVNTLVLRVNTAHNTLKEYLQHVRQVNLAAQANQDVPFEHLVEHCKVVRSTQHTPLFQVLFSMDTNETGTLNIPGVSVSVLDGNESNTICDLDISAHIYEGGIHLNWAYDISIFSRAHVEVFNEHLIRLLVSIAEKPQAKLCDLNLLSKQEIADLLYEINNNGIPYSTEKLVHELIEAKAEQFPDNIAVSYAGKLVTYQELNQQANSWAAKIRACHLAPESMVVVLLPRSIDMVTIFVSVLKSGAVYVPLNPEQPLSRIRGLLAETDADLVITLTETAVSISDIKVTCLCVDEKPSISDTMRLAGDFSAAVTEINEESPAYCIFTSGSTGRPKGVLVEQGSLVCQYKSWEKIYELDADVNNHLQMAAPSFDVAIGDMVRALCSGGKLVICPKERLLNAEKLSLLLEREKIDIAEFVPAVLRNLGEYLEASGHKLGPLRYLVVGSDAWNLEDHSRIKRLLDASTSLVNSYGLTECTIDSICYISQPENSGQYNDWEDRLSSAGDLSISVIGRPLPNVSTFVLNSRLQLQPMGAIGELYIGGPGVARGYLNQPALTAERFIRNPFTDVQGKHLYKTGDLVRYLPDGNLEFIGRVDEQFKIRGIRIEPGEIEYQLSLCEGVQSAIVLIRKNKVTREELVAYVVISNQIDDESLFVERLRQNLNGQLPDYMIPTAFLLIDEVPLTASGKLDRKALPVADERLLQGEYIAPQSATEILLVKIWSDLLELDEGRISVTGNFFELGGHSLLMISLIRAVNLKSNKKITIRDIYEFQTVSRLADYLSMSELIEEKALQSIVRLNNSTSEKKLFVIHPFGGRVDCYRELASFLVDSAQVFGIQAPCYYDYELRFQSIIELAEYYVKGIKETQPTGPYCLAGWSAGGEVACYVASLLQKSGEQIEYLSVFDSHLLVNHEVNLQESIANILQFIVGDKLDIQGSEVLDLLASETTSEAKIRLASNYLAENNVSDFEDPQLNRVFLNAGNDYYQAKRPDFYLTPESPLSLILASDKDKEEASDYIRQWEEVAGRVAAHYVSAVHKDMMLPEYVLEVALIILSDFESDGK